MINEYTRKPTSLPKASVRVLEINGRRPLKGGAQVNLQRHAACVDLVVIDTPGGVSTTVSAQELARAALHCMESS